MGYSRADKANTHERIVRVAAKRFREAGLEGVGVADLMKEAGLTVGGFYKHFGSREDLVAEAVGSALGTWQEQAEAAASAGEPLTFSRMVDQYLSEAHRDQPGEGCAIAALVGDIGRGDGRTRALFTEQIQSNIGLVAGLFGGQDLEAERARAILTISALVGAIGLSRAVSDATLSGEILKTVGKLLKAPVEA